MRRPACWQLNASNRMCRRRRIRLLVIRVEGRDGRIRHDLEVEIRFRALVLEHIGRLEKTRNQLPRRDDPPASVRHYVR